MPYKIVKQKCQQSDGTPGNWVKKLKSTNKTVSCHTSKKSAQKSIAATYANECGVNDLTSIDNHRIDEIIIRVLEELLYNGNIIR